MVNKRDLSVEFCSFLIENPFLLAASPVSRQADMIERAFNIGWGGAVTKSVSLEQDQQDSSLSPRFGRINKGGSNLKSHNNIIGMTNIDFRIDKPLKDTLDDFALIKKKYPHKFLAISIKAEYQKDKWLKLAEMAAESTPDALELCLSCPDAGCDDEGCNIGSIGQNPEAIKAVIAWIKEATDLPLIVKLNAHTGNIVSVAAAAQDAGASAIAAINTVRSISGFNLNHLKPLPTIHGISTITGLSGSVIRPLAMYVVNELVKSQTIGLPVSAIGGVTCYQDAIEYLLLGATTVQTATQVMHEGYGIIEDFKDGLLRFMDQHGFYSIKDFIAIGGKNLTASTKGLSREQKLKSNIDQNKCIGCGKCYISCQDGAYQAISFSDLRKGEVDQEKCVGCGLCQIVCPVPGAIYFTENGSIREGLI